MDFAILLKFKKFDIKVTLGYYLLCIQIIFLNTGSYMKCKMDTRLPQFPIIINIVVHTNRVFENMERKASSIQ